jgi:hypothetical protein
MITYTNTSHCLVVQGAMRILAYRGDEVNLAIAAIRTILIEIMNDGAGQRSEVSNVTFLSYLGDDKNSALLGGAETGGGNGGATVGGIVLGDTGEGGGRGKSLGVVLGVGMPIVLVLFASLVVAKSKGRMTNCVKKITRQEGNQTVESPQENDDPPNSFHSGLYHYTRRGEQYLSTNCAACVETRRRLLHDMDRDVPEQDRFIATIVEDEEADFETNVNKSPRAMVRDDSKMTLDQQHHGMNVHKCGSATCSRCNPELDQAVNFVSVPVSYVRPTPSQSQSCNSSITSRTISSGGSTLGSGPVVAVTQTSVPESVVSFDIW